MQTEKKILNTLNAALGHELTLINQTFLHARMLNNWGYDAVGGKIYKQSIRAMKNADALIARIFFLEGLPNLQDLGKLKIGEDVFEALDCDLSAFKAQREAQAEAIAVLTDMHDYVSREILCEQMEHTEEYIDWLEEQIGQVEALGKANYLQSAVGEGEAH